MKQQLIAIQQTIDRRVSAILVGRGGDWLCRAGCDHCCRHLAAIPEITESEWRQLSAALSSLPETQASGITKRVLALPQASHPFTCPFLDHTSGTCLAYESRPLACRSYGFYVERDQGLYCDRIRSEADAGNLDDVIWGNQAGIDLASAPLGTKRSLVEWIKRDLNAG